MRIGIYTGVPAREDVQYSREYGRMQYHGLPMALAKAICDSGQVR